MPFKLMRDGDAELVRTPESMAQMTGAADVQNRAFAARRLMADSAYDSGSMAPMERQAYDRRVMTTQGEDQAALNRTSAEQMARTQFLLPAQSRERADRYVADRKLWGDMATAESARTEAQIKAIAGRFSPTPTGEAIVDAFTGSTSPVPGAGKTQVAPSMKESDVPGVYWVTTPDGKTDLKDLREKQGGFPMIAPQAADGEQKVTKGTEAAAGAGALKTLSIDDARALLREAGNDKEKARALARERGFSF